MSELPSDTDIQLLIDHDWEISDDNREARLYSEGWSPILAATISTKWWIAEMQKEQPP